MMISSHEVLQKEKKDRQESYYKRTRLIREGKLKPMPESRMSSYGPIRDMSIKLILFHIPYIQGPCPCHGGISEVTLLTEFLSFCQQ